MVESETFRALRNASLRSKAIGAAPAGKAVPTPTPMAPHGYTLQFLISIIQKSQQGRPSP
jgi:hypothetical protein